MITEAMQGVAPVVVGMAVGWALVRWMQNSDNLGNGYEAHVGEWDRWGQAMRKPARNGKAVR